MPDGTTPIVDANSDEGMLREAHDLLRLARWDQMPARWLADDLVLRIAARFPDSADVIGDANRQARSAE